MIVSYDLPNTRARLESAFQLHDIEPESVLESDLKEREALEAHQLIAKDAHGAFGTAVLSKGLTQDLPESLRFNNSFLGEETYYELSLVYAEVPEQFDTSLPENTGLMESYCRQFYNELFDFLNTNIGQKALVVRTTEEESENMSYFGLWSFHEPHCEGETFQGVLKLLNREEIILETQDTREKAHEVVVH